MSDYRLAIYILKRIITGFIALVGLTIITFVLSHAGGANLAVSAYLNPNSPIPVGEQISALKIQLHLNDPIYVQYFYYIQGLVTGQWGFTATSVFTGPVLTAIAIFLPNTIELSILAIVIVLIVGIKLGLLAAQEKDGPMDNAVRIVSFIGLALPAFWFALILQETFGSNDVASFLDILPIQGVASQSLLTHVSWYTDGISYPTHLFFLDALIHGNFLLAISNLEHLVLPALTLAFSTMAIILRMMRSSAADSLSSDYIKTIRIKNLPDQYIMRYHVQKNALIPTLTVGGVLLAYFLGGVVVVEYVFNYPGIGTWITQALLADNLGGIMGATLIFGIILITANLVIDLVYLALDPRIKYQ